MFGFLQISGKQLLIEAGAYIRIDRVPLSVGTSMTLDKVLFLQDKEQTLVGRPFIPDVKILATVVSHEQDPKIVIFKKRRRQNYRRKKGHRARKTVVRIDELLIS